MRVLMGVLPVWIVFVSLVLGCAGPSVTTVPPEGHISEQRSASVVITPISGKPETRITIFGSGFVPGEEVKVEVMMSGVNLSLGISETAHTVNESGAFKIVSSIPTAMVARAGLYTVVAIGNKGSSATFPLEVLEVK